MKTSYLFCALTIAIALSASACASHEKTAKNTQEDSAPAEQRLVAENNYKQLQRTLDANKRADAERQRQRMDQAAVRETKQD